MVAGEGGYFTTPSGQRGAMLRAYDKATGKDVGEVFMNAPQTGTPMTSASPAASISSSRSAGVPTAANWLRTGCRIIRQSATVVTARGPRVLRGPCFLQRLISWFFSRKYAVTISSMTPLTASTVGAEVRLAI